MSIAIICDECGRIIPFCECVHYDILLTDKATIYDGHLSSVCDNKYECTEGENLEVVGTKKGTK